MEKDGVVTVELGVPLSAEVVTSIASGTVVTVCAEKLTFGTFALLTGAA